MTKYDWFFMLIGAFVLFVILIFFNIINRECQATIAEHFVVKGIRLAYIDDTEFVKYIDDRITGQLSSFEFDQIMNEFNTLKKREALK